MKDIVKKMLTNKKTRDTVLLKTTVVLSAVIVPMGPWKD